MANDISTLTAQKRDQAGKGPSHRLRAKGLIPAVCYGPYDKPLHVAVAHVAESGKIEGVVRMAGASTALLCASRDPG